MLTPTIAAFAQRHVPPHLQSLKAAFVCHVGSVAGLDLRELEKTVSRAHRNTAGIHKADVSLTYQKVN